MEAGPLSSHPHPSWQQNRLHVEERRGRCPARWQFSAGCLGAEAGALVGPRRKAPSGFSPPPQGRRLWCCKDRGVFAAERKLQSCFVYSPAWMREKERTRCCDLLCACGPAFRSLSLALLTITITQGAVKSKGYAAGTPLQREGHRTDTYIFNTFFL